MNNFRKKNPLDDIMSSKKREEYYSKTKKEIEDQVAEFHKGMGLKEERKEPVRARRNFVIFLIISGVVLIFFIMFFYGSKIDVPAGDKTTLLVFAIIFFLIVLARLFPKELGVDKFRCSCCQCDSCWDREKDDDDYYCYYNH